MAKTKEQQIKENFFDGKASDTMSLDEYIKSGRAERDLKNKKGVTKMKKDKKKTAMIPGGTSGGKIHMYAAGGVVKDNPGLEALKIASPEAYNKIKQG
jgi:hypothetical protein